jgi:hypothetical protein
MHPFFFMTGMPTHFKDAEGNPKAIETHIHLVSDHVKAALEAGWTLAEMYEGVIDEEWITSEAEVGAAQKLSSQLRLSLGAKWIGRPVVFDAIRGLMHEPESKRRGIGFTAKLDD